MLEESSGTVSVLEDSQPYVRIMDESIYEHISDWSLSLDLRILVRNVRPPAVARALQQRWTRIKSLKSGGFEIEERWEDVPVIVE